MKLAIVAATLLLLLPWCLGAFRALAGRPVSERIATGLSVGVAGTITIGYMLAAIGRLDLFWVAWAVCAVTAAVVWWRDSSAPALDDPALRVSLLVLALVAVVYAIPVAVLRFPPGWDPAFHSLIARKIFESHSLAADWTPFESVAVNYTQGVHVLVAIVSRWSGRPIHEVLLVLPVIVQITAVLQIGVLSRQIFRDWRVQPAAMATYGLVAHLGSYSSYLEWGGLPTEVGALFLLTFLSLVLANLRGVSIAAGVVLFGSLALTHHLSALIASWVLVFYIIVSRVTSVGTAIGRRLFMILAATAIVYSPFLIPYSLRAATIGETDALRYGQDTMKSLPALVVDLGPLAVALALIGLVLVWRTGREPDENEAILLSWLTSLIVAFAILGYGWRYVAWITTGETGVPFTPSRWLTLAAYPMAIYAGRAVVATLDLIAREHRSRQRWIAVVLLAGAVATALPRMLDLARVQPLSARHEQMLLEVRDAAPPDSLLIFDGTSRLPAGTREWVPYLTGRPTTHTPLPASENQHTLRAKQEVFMSGDARRIFAWLEENGLELHVVTITPGNTILVSPVKEPAQ